MIGKTLSHYRLVSELGKGGMGVVYKARDERLPRYVAIKVLRAEYAQSEASRHRFLHEARAVAVVPHPYIAGIHDADEVDGILFIAMEYVEGKTLRDILRAGPYPLRDALHRSCEVAEGLAHVHAAGIIHRDLKPSNIMVSAADGHAKILDFGIAKLVEERDVETTALLTTSLDDTSRPVRSGTPAYMSPEQVRGEAVDQRSDVFAFGCTLFETLTRRPLFGRRSQGETLAAILRDDAVPASALNPEVPQELDRILAKCLAKDARERYQDTRDLVTDLDRLRWKWEGGAVAQHDTIGNATTHTLPADALQGIPHVVEPSAPVQTAPPSQVTGGGQTRRFPRRLTLVLGTAAILGILLIVALDRWNSGRHKPDTFYTRGLYYLREESESVNSVDTAIRMFNQSLAQDSTAASTWAVLGEAYWIRFQLSKEQPFKDEAEAAVVRALALEPKSAAAINAQGRGFLAQGRYEEARQVLQQAVDVDKQHAFAWANLGRAHQGLRNYAEGSQAIQRAIELEPGSFRHYISLGNFYRSFQEREAAIAAYRQAIDLKPNSNYAWNNLGTVYLQMASYQEAIDAFNASIQVVDNGTARSNLGSAYLAMGNHEAAEQEYRRAVALDPQELAHYENLIDALIKGGKHDEVQATSRTALEQARNLVARTPQDAKANLRLATLCARAGDAVGATMALAKALELEPQDAQILLRGAKVYGILNEGERALDVLEKAVKLGLSKVEITSDPDLEVLRDNPRFQRLLVLAS